MRAPIAAVTVVACAVVAARPAAAADGKALYPLVAEDAQFVAVADLADLRDARSFEALIAATGLDAQLTAATAKLGIDLRKDVDLVLVGGTADAFVIAIEGRFTAAQKKRMTDGATAKQHRGVAYWVASTGEVAHLGKRVVIAAAGTMPAVIDRWKKKQRSLARGPGAATLRDAIAMTDTRHDVWLAATADLLTARGMPASNIDAVSLAASLETDIVLEVRARAADADTATTLEATLGRLLPQAQDAMKGFGLAGTAASLQTDRDDRVLALAATIPASEVAAIVTLVQH